MKRRSESMILMMVITNMHGLPSPYSTGSSVVVTDLLASDLPETILWFLSSSWTVLLSKSGTLLASMIPLMSPLSASSRIASFFHPSVIYFHSFGSTSPTNGSKSSSSCLYFLISLILFSLSKFLSSIKIKVLLCLLVSNLKFLFSSENLSHLSLFLPSFSFLVILFNSCLFFRSCSI